MSSPRPHKRRKLNDSTGVASVLPAQTIIEWVKAIYATPISDVVEDYLLQKKSITDILPRLLYLRATEKIELANYLYHQFDRFHMKHWLPIYSRIGDLSERQHFIYKQFLPNLNEDFKYFMRRDIQDEHIYLGELARAKGQKELAIQHFQKAGDYGRQFINGNQGQLNPQHIEISSATYANAYDLFFERTKQGDLWSLFDIAMLSLGKMVFFYSDDRSQIIVNYPLEFIPDFRFAIELLEFIRSHKPNDVDDLYDATLTLLANVAIANNQIEENDAIKLVKLFYEAKHNAHWLYLDPIDIQDGSIEACFQTFYHRYSSIPEVKFYLLLIFNDPYPFLGDEIKGRLLHEISLFSDEDKIRFAAIVKKEYSFLIDSVILTLLQDPAKHIKMMESAEVISTMISTALVEIIGDHAKTDSSSEATIPYDSRTLIGRFRAILRIKPDFAQRSTPFNNSIIRFIFNPPMHRDPLYIHHLLMLALEYPGFIHNNYLYQIKRYYSESDCFDLLPLCDLEDKQQTSQIVSHLDDDVKYKLAYTLHRMQWALINGDGENRVPLPPELVTHIFSYLLGDKAAAAYMSGKLLCNESRQERLAHLTLLNLSERTSRSTPSRYLTFFYNASARLSTADEGHTSYKFAYQSLNNDKEKLRFKLD